MYNRYTWTFLVNVKGKNSTADILTSPSGKIINNTWYENDILQSSLHSIWIWIETLLIVNTASKAL